MYHTNPLLPQILNLELRGWKREIFKDSSNSNHSMIQWNSWVQKHILSGKQTWLSLGSLKPPFILFDTHHPARKTGFIFEIPN